MKALVVSQEVYDGILGLAYNQGQVIKRLVIKQELDYLTLTLFGNEVLISTHGNLPDCRVIREIEIPDVLLEKIKKFQRARQQLNRQQVLIRSLFGEY